MNAGNSPLGIGDKKAAIVTGGGSGLGFAIAERFTHNGILTIIAGRDKEKLENAKTQLGELCHAIPCDVSKLASIPGFVADVINQFGHIDILVNNAGINMKKEFTEVTDEDFHEQGSSKRDAEKGIRLYHQHQFHGSTIRVA